MSVYKPHVDPKTGIKFYFRYRLRANYKGFIAGEIVRLVSIVDYSRRRGCHEYEWEREDFSRLNVEVGLSTSDPQDLRAALEEVDHFTVNEDIFEYEAPNGQKLQKKFEGQIRAVLFAFDRIYITEAKKDQPTNLFCLDYDLNEVWVDRGKGGVWPYDRIYVKDKKIEIYDGSSTATFEPLTGQLLKAEFTK